MTLNNLTENRTDRFVYVYLFLCLFKRMYCNFVLSFETVIINGMGKGETRSFMIFESTMRQKNDQLSELTDLTELLGDEASS